LIAELKRRGEMNEALEEAADQEIFTKVEKRKLEKDIAWEMDNEALVSVSKARGICRGLSLRLGLQD